MQKNPISVMPRYSISSVYPQSRIWRIASFPISCQFSVVYLNFGKLPKNRREFREILGNLFIISRNFLHTKKRQCRFFTTLPPGTDLYSQFCLQSFEGCKNSHGIFQLLQLLFQSLVIAAARCFFVCHRLKMHGNLSCLCFFP